jgi:hypothetical protein
MKIKELDGPSTNIPDTVKPGIETYLNKCFQIRIDVPNMTMNDWVSMAKNLLNKACPQIPKSVSDYILYTMQLYRSSITDNPNPRTLKLYINQIGFYYSSTHSFYEDKEFPFKSLSFFIIKKYLDNSKNDSILKSLISSEYEVEKVIYKLEEQYIEHIACFSYFLEPNKAIELFIEKNINVGLSETDHEKLQNLANKFPSSFWFLFDKLNKQDVEFLTNLPTLHKAFWEKHEFNNSKKQIILLINKIGSNEINYLLKLSSEENQKYYDALNCICEIYKRENRINDIFELINCIGNQNKNITFHISNFNVEIPWIKKIYVYFLEVLSKLSLDESKQNMELSNFTFTIQFLRQWKKEHIKFFKISEDFHSIINEKSPMENNLLTVFMLKNYVNYCIFTNYELSDKFVTDVLNNLENSMSNESTEDNLDTIDVLISLFNTQKYNDIMQEHFTSFNLAPIISSLIIDEETKTKVCFLYGMLSPGTEIFQEEEKLEVREFWMNRDRIQADQIVSLINKIENPFDIKAKLWNLTKYNYHLILDVLLNKDMKTNYFELDNFFENLNGILSLHPFNDEEKKFIISKCFENTPTIIQEILEPENIINYPNVYLVLVDFISQMEKEKITEFIKTEDYEEKIKTKLILMKYDINESSELIDNQLKLIKKLNISDITF